MRILLLFFLTIFLCRPILAEDFSVFERNGRFGIKDDKGEITVPAVYEKLGWSNGSEEVVAGVIGFKRNNLWGLVSIKNKVLTENKFYTIDPFKEDLILASIKGRFSNHLFYGILDNSGIVKISFNYFSLESIGDYFLVTEFDQYHSKVGIASTDNRIVIPIKYRTITLKDQWFVAEQFDDKKDLYRGSTLVVQRLDSLRKGLGQVCYKNGLAGYVDSMGIQKFDFKYKDILEADGGLSPIEFPLWEVYKDGNKILERNCDSLSLSDGFWTMHLSGVKHKVFSTDDFDISNQYELQAVVGNNLVVRDVKTNKWSVIDKTNKIIIRDQFSIEVSGNHFITQKEGKCNVFNGFGTKINRFPMQNIRSGVDDHFMVKRNDYWGVIDFTGKTYINFKYDSIHTSGNYYITKFHGKWGILDKYGNWKFYPEYDEIHTYDDLRIGRKGSSYTYFYKDHLLYKTTSTIESQLGDLLIIKDEEGKQGLISNSGNILQQPAFDSLKRVGDYLIFFNSGVSILSMNGSKILVGSDEQYENFGESGEGYISAKKHNRWGFVDEEGRLRVSNRYEDVQPFQEGYAAIMLRGRWGFIDKSEKLVVQPHYQQVSSFHNGLAIVKENDKFGLINKSGEEVVEIDWVNIIRTVNNNYLIENDKGLVGLVDVNGTIILRPNFEFIKDLKRDNIIVKQNGMMGVLDYKGGQKFKFSYSKVQSVEDFLLLMK